MTLAVKKQKILKRQKPCISVSRSFKKSEPKFEKLRLFGFRCGMGLKLETVIPSWFRSGQFLAKIGL